VIYLLDTNAISDLMEHHPKVRRQAAEHINAGHQLTLCRPVYYEIMRALLWRGATRQIDNLVQSILPLFVWSNLEDRDWEQAAQFWADARRVGRQLGDPDLLLASLTYRLNAVLVSADADFDALPIHRADWRI
jgi:predicted nucleic acid-binding protein